jgi:hypothetical protein
MRTSASAHHVPTENGLALGAAMQPQLPPADPKGSECKMCDIGEARPPSAVMFGPMGLLNKSAGNQS